MKKPGEIWIDIGDGTCENVGKFPTKNKKQLERKIQTLTNEINKETTKEKRKQLLNIMIENYKKCIEKINTSEINKNDEILLWSLYKYSGNFLKAISVNNIKINYIMEKHDKKYKLKVGTEFIVNDDDYEDDIYDSFFYEKDFNNMIEAVTKAEELELFLRN